MSMKSEPGPSAGDTENSGANQAASGAAGIGEASQPQPQPQPQHQPPGWLLPVKIASVVMGIMIVVGVVVLVVTVAGRIGGSGERKVAGDIVASQPAAIAAPEPASGAVSSGAVSSGATSSGASSGILSDVARMRPSAFGDVAVDLPSGAEVIGVTLGAERMAIRIQMPDRSERILVLSLIDGTHLGRVNVLTE